MTANYGLTNWEDVEIKQPQANKQKELYMKLEDGQNKIRILTKPHQYLVHHYKTNEKDPGFGVRILSSIHHGSDPLIDRGLKPRRRWLVGIIDRKTDSYKILDMSVSVFKSIQNLTRNEDWGDPSQYDITINVDKNGGPNGYYTVIPNSKKPLSAADIEIKQQIDLEDLKRRCTPPTPEQVEERVRAVDEKSPNGPAKKTSNSSQDDDDEDVDFPVVDGSDNV